MSQAIQGTEVSQTDIHARRMLILDFGSQYTQLIARRVRECGVYSEIHAWDMDDSALRDFAPSGIILSGGPESVNLADPPRVSSAVFELGVPVLGMVYPRGPNLKVADDDDTGGVAHAARIAWELGCNVVKVPWNGSVDSFHRVTDAVPIPVLIAGGPRDTSFRELLDIVEAAMGAGGGGVCMGRQVFGAEDPTAHVRALRAIVHDGASAAEAAELLGE